MGELGAAGDALSLDTSEGPRMLLGGSGLLAACEPMKLRVLMGL